VISTAWVRNAAKLQIVKFISHFATIVTDGIVHVHKEFSLAKSMENLPSYFRNIGQDIIDEIFLIESRTRWQCIQGNPIHTAEENRQHNFLGPYRGFFSWNHFISARCEYMLRWI
jgi:hypothetical protein